MSVLLGVTGCIAAYKACELARRLVRAGCRVTVVMTQNATRFVGPATFRALTGEPVAVSLWEEPSARVHHTSLAEQAEVFCIAPATANVVAKLATGRADDLLTTVALATEAPLVIAPAMNVHMWRAEPTRANLELLRARGAVIVEPDVGELACGEIGEGRLARIELIEEAVLTEVQRAHDLDGVNVLVTAGPTRESIDAVRFISNPSSGRTGHAVAEEAARRGAVVTLVTGPTVLPDPFRVSTIRVTTASEMRAAVMEAFPAADVVVASAAVSDFRPRAPHAGKQAKEDAPLSIELERTPDILAEVGAVKGERLLVGFAAEVGDPVVRAREKLVRKRLDLVVANDVGRPGLGFASEANEVVLVWPDREERLPVMSKRALARRLWDELAARAQEARRARRGSST